MGPEVLTRRARETEPPPVLESELLFYEQRSWCLNAFPTLGEVIIHLGQEMSSSAGAGDDWRRAEALTNVFLLSCAVSDTVDDYLLGPRYDFSQAVGVFGPSRLIAAPINAAFRLAAGIRNSLLQKLCLWRDGWETAVGEFMRMFAAGAPPDNNAPNPWRASLLPQLGNLLPADLLAIRPRIPAAFRSQDLTHFDAFELGRKFVDACPDHDRPILVAGLRTAGSYFAPLLGGYLQATGYDDVATVTLRPKRGLGARERALLARAAKRRARAVLIDEPVYSAGTLAEGLAFLEGAGFPAADTVALFPVHPNRRNWTTGVGNLVLSGIRVLTLKPEEWHKQALLDDGAAARRLRAYLQRDGTVDVEVRPDAELTAALDRTWEPGFHCRLKRIYKVEWQDGDGSARSRRVLAKSVGWGWLGYHAFLVGTRLAPFVPVVLGLRDGILYMDWCQPDHPRPCGGPPSRRLLDSAASYVAARVRSLGLGKDPTRDLVQAGRHRGTDELAGILSGAYGTKIAAALRRPRIQCELSNLPCGVPTLIDGKMRRLEWINGADGVLKTDFEHHGMGKHELNLSDPAYDLAEFILHWTLSEQQEGELIGRYVAKSGDRTVARRLFLNKLLAGTWAMARAADNLKDPRLLERHDEFNQRYLEARNFLTFHTARFCAGFCRRREDLRWSAPLIVLDVDGVLDKQIFGFPSTTAAGMEAVSLFATHGVAVALNTARSCSELKEYCREYGFVGGVAEYGSFVWDAVTGREQVLLSPESLAQLQQLKEAIKAIPGVFVDPACRWSVRAYTYARGATVPLPEMLVCNLMARLRLNRLRLHQTYTDSTVTAAEADKGTGLNALLSMAGQSELETVAIGDSESDLPMFRVASRCFAPAQIACPRPARLLGCRIAARPYQRGLLEIARSIVHPQGGRCRNCLPPREPVEARDALMLRLLGTADHNAAALLVQSLFEPKALRAFTQ